jgi:hypothetical protein
MEFDDHGNVLSPTQIRARAMAQGKIKPKPKPSGRLVISGSRMENKTLRTGRSVSKSQYIPQMQGDMREFLTCANTSYPDLTLVHGDAPGVDQTGGSIWEELGGSVAKVPHDEFSGQPAWKKPLKRNEAMLTGGYTIEDFMQTGLWASNVKDRGYKYGGKTIKGRKEAPLGTSPKGAFLAFWSHEDDGFSLKDKTSKPSVDSTGTWNTVKTGNQILGRDAVCDVWKTGAAECCAELKRILG